MDETNDKEEMSSQNKSRRHIIKKAYSIPMIALLGTVGSPLNAGVSDLGGGPPLPPGRNAFEPQPWRSLHYKN